MKSTSERRRRALCVVKQLTLVPARENEYQRRLHTHFMSHCDDAHLTCCHKNTRDEMLQYAFLLICLRKHNIFTIYEQLNNSLSLEYEILLSVIRPRWNSKLTLVGILLLRCDGGFSRGNLIIRALASFELLSLSMATV